MDQHDDRPDPDALLGRVLAKQARQQGARLKIFVGYAPGVGKTYAMLESAGRLAAQGVDVVVGVVETHGRSETGRLLQALEVLPRRAVEYRGTRLAEFDLDKALERRPKVLLLDELAHTNAPGTRHPKRWQDALELLDAGIDVHTTLNVQHVESLNDIVLQITSIRVRETVPDSMLDRADEIEVVDVPPEELLARLREGKVYVPDQALRATGHFFRRGNLLALRELTLRRAAERLDADVLAYRREHEIETTWPAAERILVAVGPSPSSSRIVRAARRMAVGLRAPWVAVYVEAPDEYPMTREDRDRLQAHLRLAESLGGEVVRLSGSRVSDELLRYARDHNVTRIVTGKPTHSPARDYFKGSIVNRLVRDSGQIEVHFIAGDEGPTAGSDSPARRPRLVDRAGLAAAAVLVAAVTIVGQASRGLLSDADLLMTFLLVIMVVAFRFGRLPSLAAASLSVAAYDFFFVPPFFTFNVTNSRHLLTFAMMFGLGIVISGLTSRLQQQGREARVREDRTAALYSLTRELAAVIEEQAAADITARHAADTFGGRVTVLLRGADGRLAIRGRSHADASLSDDELGVAGWAGEHGRPAGSGTDTLPGAALTCMPLQSGPDTFGVIALERPSRDMLQVENRAFLDAFVRQAGLAIERARLAEQARVSALQARTEQMRSSLLSAVSHDMRTPLAAITGAGTALRDDHGRLDAAERAELFDTICVEADRMERLISNILDMVRLESGGIRPKREWVPLEEVVGSALARLASPLAGRDVQLELPSDLPLVFVDPILLEQVFVNLVDNATKYAGGAIGIGAKRHPDTLEITVFDSGPGLPPGQEARVFEKFYRGPGAPGGGVGLGLAICLGIVNAHGGSLSAANRPGGGAVFTVRLPIEAEPPPVGPIQDAPPPGAGESMS